MLQIGQAIISLDIIEKHFVCNLHQCKGMCCVYGEAGAPLDDDETAILQAIYPKIKPYMTPDGINVVEQNGVYTIDWDSDRVTPLIGNSEDCVYACKEDGVVYCAIEKAFLNGEISFRKPISCHLYPIRITRHTHFDAVNYHPWNICSSALKLGKKVGTPLYTFLKEPLVRKYGADWYQQLCIAAEQIEKGALKNNMT
jgi:hypothetical protein